VRTVQEVHRSGRAYFAPLQKLDRLGIGLAIERVWPEINGGLFAVRRDVPGQQVVQCFTGRAPMRAMTSRR
jgi:hypothetical protein